MRAAAYARLSSENQPEESIADQIASCRRLATGKGLRLLSDHIYTDYPRSGPSPDRSGLVALIAAAKAWHFEVVLVDDLSRLAGDATYMLRLLVDLRYHGIRVISVAGCLDTGDEEATLGIQRRGIFNQLLLSDLRKKTIRGERGQEEN